MLVRLKMVLLLALCLVACSPPAVQQQAPMPVESVASAEAARVEAVERVVALTSLSADILHRLDADKLVGIPGSRLLRAEGRFAGLTAVSEGRTPPSIEKIVALDPDLVIGAVGFHESTLEQLAIAGIKTLAIDVSGWSALEDVTRQLAEVVAADPEPLLATYRRALSTTPSAAPTALVLVSREPILAPTQASWAGDLLARSGMTNTVANFEGSASFQGYAPLSPEKVLTENPEILILVDTRDGAVEALKSASFWQELQAVKTDRVYTFDYYGLVNPGSVSTIVSASEKLAEIVTQFEN